MAKATEVQEQEVVQMADAKLDPLIMADEIGLSLPTIYGIMRKFGYKVAKPGRKSTYDRLTPEEMEDIRNRYEDANESVASIMADYGIGGHSVFYALLRKMGIAMRTKTLDVLEVKEMMMDQAVNMYVGGHPLYDIFEDTGIHQPRLHAELHKRGIELRRPRKVKNVKKPTNAGFST